MIAVSHFTAGNFAKRPARVLFLLAALLCMSQPSSVFSEEDRIFSETEVKAAYVYNFLQFISWPSEENGEDSGPLRICALGEGATAGKLKDLSGRLVRGREIRVSSVAFQDSLDGCHIAYIALEGEPELPKILKKLEGTDVLTVSSIPRFARKGGMIGFVTEKKRVRIEINVGAAKKTRLGFSAKLMEVAGIIK